LAKSASVPFDEDSQLAAGSYGPVITNVVVSNVASNSAVLTWTTDVISTSQVKVKKSGTSGWVAGTRLDTPAQTAGVTSHSVTVTGLLANTKYYYRVLSCDISNNCKYKPSPSALSFTTLPTQTIDVCPNIVGNQATVPTGMYLDIFGNCVATTTTDVTPPSVPTGLTATNVSATGFTLTWSPSTDDTLTASQIHYDVYGPTSACNVNGSAGYCGGTIGATSMTFTNLTANTTYTGSSGVNAGFLVQAYDTAGHYSAGSSRLSVTTSGTSGGDTTPPNMSNVYSSGITTTQVTINWTTNEPSNSVVNYGTSMAYGTLATNNTMVTTHAVTITNLTPGTTYMYEVRSTDAAGNTGTTGENAFTTTTASDTTAPTISGVTSSNVTTSGATISWTTNEASTSQIVYGTTSGSYPNTWPASPDANMVTSHSLQLSGLNSATRYYFKVKSADAAGNLATSSESSVLTSSSTACGNTTSDPYGTKGMWIWSNVSGIITPNSTSQTDLFNFANSHAISRLYLYTSSGTLSGSVSNLKDFLNKARTHCIEVWAMDGAPSWIAVPNSTIFRTGNTTNAAVTFANTVKNINASITGTNAKFAGASFDVEPHGLKSASYPGYAIYWNDADAVSIQKLNSALIEMIDKVKTTLSGSGVPFDITIARWDDSRSEINAANNRIYTCNTSVNDCTYTSPGISIAEMIFNRADHVTVMNYVTNASSFWNDGKDELSMAIARGKKATLAVETVSGQGSGTSFYGSSCTTLNNMLLGAWSTITANGRQAGLDMLAVHEYASNAYLSVCP
jgi:hypothetical protein